VDDAFGEVVMIMQSRSNKKSVSIEVDVDPGLTVFSAAMVKFKQILYNLISNVIKFTHEGGSDGIRAESLVNRNAAVPWALEGQELLRVSVWDKGKGGAVVEVYENFG
jgi:signal transduction histidine kinase